MNVEFFNDLSKRFTSVAKSVSEKTKDSVEVTRISSDLRAQKNQLEQLYAELGKTCYAIRMGSGDADEAEALAGRIQSTLSRIEELQAMRDVIRDVRRCPACGVVMSREARFCSNCGKRMPEDAPKPEPENLAEFCPDCGAQRKANERFCAVCGKPFEDPKRTKKDTPPAPPARKKTRWPEAEEPQDFEG